MKTGEVVRMKSATVQFGNAKARGSVSMKAFPGKEMVFLLLGSCEAGNPDSLDAGAALRSLGWIPNPDLVADVVAGAAP